MAMTENLLCPPWAVLGFALGFLLLFWAFHHG